MKLHQLGQAIHITLNGNAVVVIPSDHPKYKYITKLEDYKLEYSSGSPDAPTFIFSPRKVKKDKFILFWVRRNEFDSPYIIRNPPKNLGDLLREWNTLDEMLDETSRELDYVNVWLKKRGVDIFQASKELLLDEFHQPESNTDTFELSGKQFNAITEALGCEPDIAEVQQAVIEYKDKDLKTVKKLLRRKEKEFKLAGGNGMDLAYKIDKLRMVVAFRSCLVVRP